MGFLLGIMHDRYQHTQSGSGFLRMPTRKMEIPETVSTTATIRKNTKESGVLP